MPRLIVNDYAPYAAQKGSVIDVPYTNPIALQDVTPAATPPSTADVAPGYVQVPLDQWKEAPFYMTDQDLLTSMNGTIPLIVAEAVKAVAEGINSYILSQMAKGFYIYGGTGGTTPFGSDVALARTIRRDLNKARCPISPRRFVVDPDAEANLLARAEFTQYNTSGEAGAQNLIEGSMGRRFGFDWFMDQQVASFTKGTGASYAGTGTAGNKTVTLATGTGTVLVGDIVTFAGGTETYVVTAGVAAPGVISIYPSLTRTLSSAAMTIVTTTGVQNVAFHRDAFAFAIRPMQPVDPNLGSIVNQAVDPVSGLALRLEITREHKRTRWSFDALYGGKVVRPELGARLLG